MKHKYRLEYKAEEFALIIGMVNNFIDRTVEVAHTAMENSAKENKRQRKKGRKTELKDLMENLTDKMEDLSTQIDEIKFESKTQSHQFDRIVDELNKMEDRIDAINDGSSP